MEITLGARVAYPRASAQSSEDTLRRSGSIFRSLGILGQPGDAEPLLGVVTLEILGLVFDPFRRVLHPMRALMV